MALNALQDERALTATLINYFSIGGGEIPERKEVENMAIIIAKRKNFSGNVRACVDATMIAIDTRMSLGTSLIDTTDRHDNNWVKNRKDIDWIYSNAYGAYLASEERWNTNIISDLNQVGFNILSYLHDPKIDGNWDRRGLVIGHVQSGKTANYINVLTKAADAGYKFIIVIAGIQNDLRKQTQQRIEKGFVGLSSENDTAIGVGKLNHKHPHPFTVTTVNNDFSLFSVKISHWKLNNIKTPIIFVIKKNVMILKSLYKWLMVKNADISGRISDVPMLMIDDEADNASINTNKIDLNPTKTNLYLRKILKLFDKSSYVGYTATPFANIFIDPNAYDKEAFKELFPKDFIYSLDAPTAYFGPDKVFLREETSSSIVQKILDCEKYIPLRQRNEAHHISAIPPSLKMAINQFIVTRAIRNIRGQSNKHHSMMVNVSRFISVQKDVRALISSYVKKVQDAVKANYALPKSLSKSNDHMKELEQCFVSEFSKCGFSWADIKKELYSVFEHLHTYMINSKSNDSLDYEKYESDGVGLTAIAVGGAGLSRGLTIEGLCISYMYRNTRMYDTLMQMGRWFGYRPGYDDLCRVHLAPDAIDWYQHIASATEELQQQIKIMQEDKASPKEFGLYVETYPGRLLMITAPNKMRLGKKIKLRYNFSLRLEEVTILPTDEDVNSANENLIREYWKNGFGGREISKDRKKGWFILDVQINVIREFIRKFETHADYAFYKKAILDFIDILEDQHNVGDVVLRSVEKNAENEETFTLGFQTRKTWDTGKDYWKNRKSRVGSLHDENIGLSREQIEEAKKNSNSSSNAKNEEIKLASHYRSVRNKPLLLLHVLNIESEHCQQRVPTFGISFPKGNYAKSVEADIVANQKYIDLMYGESVGEDADDE